MFSEVVRELGGEPAALLARARIPPEATARSVVSSLRASGEEGTEREGFEPSVGGEPYTGLAILRLRPCSATSPYLKSICYAFAASGQESLVPEALPESFTGGTGGATALALCLVGRCA